MRAAVLRRFACPLEVENVEEPRPRRGEVLIRVRAAGLCGTDLKLRSGALPNVRLPRIPGHEVAGEVVEDAGHLSAGQRVACYIYESCGRCRTCRLGRGSVCRDLVRIGVERDGGLADLMVLPVENALPISDAVRFDSAAVAMDSVLTPWTALRSRANLGAGETLLVVGAGGLGLNAIQIGVAAGARVAVIDKQPATLGRALEVGAELAVEPDDAGAVADWSGGGADVALETSGSPQGFRAAFAAVRPAGRVVVCGYEVGSEYAFDSARLPLEELTIIGARVGTRDEAREVISAIEAGVVRPTIMDALPLHAVNTALDRLTAGEVIGRLVIDMAA
jgi:D-arabinose 1-dehydrogenase-like Zn-dependent alcohol dehydrogenase